MRTALEIVRARVGLENQRITPNYLTDTGIDEVKQGKLTLKRGTTHMTQQFHGKYGPYGIVVNIGDLGCTIRISELHTVEIELDDDIVEAIKNNITKVRDANAEIRRHQNEAEKEWASFYDQHYPKELVVDGIRFIRAGKKPQVYKPSVIQNLQTGTGISQEPGQIKYYHDEGQKRFVIYTSYDGKFRLCTVALDENGKVAQRATRYGARTNATGLSVTPLNLEYDESIHDVLEKAVAILRKRKAVK